MTDLKITTMINTPQAVDALTAGKWDVIISDCADFERERTCHILFLPKTEALVAPLIPSNSSPVPDWDGVKRYLHYGHSARELQTAMTGYARDQDYMSEPQDYEIRNPAGLGDFW